MRSPALSHVTVWALFLMLLLVLCGCGPRKTLVELGDRDGTLYFGNSAEPASIDPHLALGDIEMYVMMSLYEGLVSGSEKEFTPVPGVAESWDISTNGLVYTFHMRHNAKWSNGDPLTAQDFTNSWHRMLLPSLAAQNSYMLFAVKNAEAFNTGKLTDFNQVGFSALENYTVQITLESPAPYFLSMMIHQAWYPVHIPTILKCGALDDRSGQWTKPENFVGNGPFVLKEWKVFSHILVVKSPTYWDAKDIRLNRIWFDPDESSDTEERMFRSGMTHTMVQPLASKIDFYRKYHPDLIRIDPQLSTYFYKLNVTRPPLNDKRVREALAMAIDRKAICETVARGGEAPAFFLTPPNTAGYTCKTAIREDIPAAQKLLAAAGYPNGQGFPKIELLFNTLESHKAIAEALQQMWKNSLNIDVVLHNSEWKVYLDSQHRQDYYISRAGWTGDYVDPNTFLNLWVTGGGQNETGFSNEEYDHWIEVAGSTGDQAVRFAAFQKAEAILMDEMPIIPIYFYTRPRLIRPEVKGWYPNPLDMHDYRYVYLEAPKP